MPNVILKVIKKQNWGELEYYGFEKKNGDRQIKNCEKQFQDISKKKLHFLYFYCKEN